MKINSQRSGLRIWFGSVAVALVLLACCPQSAEAQTNTFPDTGNVGIGTMAPAARLDVRRNDGSDLLVRAWNEATSSGAAIFRAAASSSGNEAARLELTDNTGYNGGISGDHTNGLTFRTGNQSLSYSAMGTRMTITPAGNIGIGTTAPSTPLHVFSNSANVLVGNIASGYGAIGFQGTLNVNNFALTGSTTETVLNTPTGTSLSLRVNNSLTNTLVLNSSGNVGIGTSTPNSHLEVSSGPSQFAPAINIMASSHATSERAAISFGANSGGTLGWSFGQDRNANGTRDTYLYDISNGRDVMYWGANGTVGIGTITPSAAYKLDVNGNTNVTGNFNTTGTITGGTINAKYQDVAEWVESSQALAAGTVVVLDHTRSNQVIASSQAYDTRVAGVISSQPGITLGESGAGKVLVATTGRVKIKVDASAGPIQIGDLLVTSDKEGVAKKSEPLSLGGVAIHRPGTLIGKALEPLARGTGEILVLLSLQ